MADFLEVGMLMGLRAFGTLSQTCIAFACGSLHQPLHTAHELRQKQGHWATWRCKDVSTAARTLTACRMLSFRRSSSPCCQAFSGKECGRKRKAGATLIVSRLGSGTRRPATQKRLGPISRTLAPSQ